ncbi:MAG: outer membrane beta-barrel protein [Bacteroidales bacterium]|nr:outer membrane beta-barrel protein [Bacteroidales bacterium]
MNKFVQAAALIAVFAFLPLTLRSQAVDSTFTSYDWIRPSVVSSKTSVLKECSDTSVFNPSSVLLHDGASLDALLMEMPGLSIDARGGVSINGRPVRELLIEGRRYFGTDVAAGLRNIPASLVASVKAYEKDSDSGLISGIDQADKAMVIDITVKKNYKRRFNNTLKAALGWKDKYDGRYNGTLISERGIYSAVAGSGNLGAMQKSSGTTVRTGLGDNCDKRQSEAGFTYSVRTLRDVEINASALYKSTGRKVNFKGHEDYYRTSGYHYSENSGLDDEQTGDLTVQGTVEWKKPGKWRMMLKPLLSYLTTAARDSLYGESFRGDSLSPYYISLRRSAGGGEAFKAGASFIISRKMSRRGRSLSLDVNTMYHADNQQLRASTDGTFRIRNRTFSSWTDRESRLRVNGWDLQAQFLYNEPFSRHHSMQLSYKQTWRTDAFDRNNTLFDEKVPVRDDSQCAYGSYNYLSGDFSAAYRLKLERMNLTAGVSVIPLYSECVFRQESGESDTAGLRVYVCPRIIVNWMPGEHNSLKFTYKGYAWSQSVKQMLPLATNTNPVYLKKPNPGLRPSFTQEMTLTWKLSDANGSRGVSLGGNFKHVKDGVSSMIENNPESGGRIVTPVNVDGNLSAGLELSSHLAAGDFMLGAHFVSDYTRKRLYIFNDVEKASQLGAMRTGFIKQSIVAAYRIPRFEATVLAEGELSDNRLDLRPDMDLRPWALSAGVSFTWQPGGGWTLSADARGNVHRGYAYGSLNRNELIVNSKISKSILNGKIVFQLDARDILRNLQNEVFTMNTDRRGFKIYEGGASYILGRLMIIL